MELDDDLGLLEPIGKFLILPFQLFVLHNQLTLPIGFTASSPGSQAGGRAAFLKELCGEDEALQREAELLLAYEEQAAVFMETPALEVAAKAEAEDQELSMLGRQLGSYEILSLLGAGGMGEVYRAKDSKLGREVAVKILPQVFVNNPDRLTRFRREARLLAALNHPNVAAIYGLEESDNTHYLVLELVLGDTLAKRLAAGPLGIEEALRICSQIAEALEAAHQKGVIHRDLKPANIKVTSESKVKVLDFGLAKAFSSDKIGGDPARSPMVAETGTGEGVIVGTAAYISPEQARGKPLDKRTDIWSFGCVLYECLTATMAFPAETVSDTIAAILEREPN